MNSSLNGDPIFDTEERRNRTAIREEAEEKELKKQAQRLRWRFRWLLMKRGFQFLILFIVLGLFAWVFRARMFYTVDSGNVDVVFYRFLGGTNHNSIGHEGLHIIAPWDRIYIYKIQTQTLVKTMTVLSKNGLEVNVDAQIRFHPIPEMVPYLHRRYGPEYVNTAVIPQLTEAVQGVIGQFLPEEVYSSSTGATANRLFGNAKRIVGGLFIEVEDIALFNIKLPPKVQESIQAKAGQQQEAEAAKFKVEEAQQEYLRTLKEIEGLKEYAKLGGIPRSVLIWKGIQATLELAKSPNAKIIVFGSKDNLPLMLGNVPDLAEK